MTGVEVRIEGAAACNRLFRLKVGDANPAADVGETEILTGCARLLAGIGRIAVRAGEIHSLALEYHPLILVVLAVVGAFRLNGVFDLIVDETVGRKQRNAAVQGFIIRSRIFVHILCKIISRVMSSGGHFALVSFYAEEDLLVRIDAPSLHIGN